MVVLSIDIFLIHLALLAYPFPLVRAREVAYTYGSLSAYVLIICCYNAYSMSRLRFILVSESSMFSTLLINLLSSDQQQSMYQVTSGEEDEDDEKEKDKAKKKEKKKNSNSSQWSCAWINLLSSIGTSVELLWSLASKEKMIKYFVYSRSIMIYVWERTCNHQQDDEGQRTDHVSVWKER